MRRTQVVLVCCLAVFFGALPVVVAQDPAAAHDEDAVVLQVGAQAVTRSDFEERFAFYSANLAASQNIPLNEQTRPLFEQLRPVYLEQLAAEQLVVAVALAQGIVPDEAFVAGQLEAVRASFASPEAYAAALEQAGVGSEERLAVYLREADLSNQIIGRFQEAAVIPDYLVRLSYEANRARFSEGAQTCARHILLATEEEAEAARAELAAGADFGAIAAERSLDPGSAGRGGDLGCFPEGVTVPSFEAAAFSTPVGAVSTPTESPYGYHLILPYERQAASLVPLAQVEAEIRQELGRAVVRKVFEGYRDTIPVETFPDRLTPQEGEEE